MSHIMGKSIDIYSAVLGEFAWHSLVLDPDIAKNSQHHYHQLVGFVNKWLPDGPKNLLEVGAYAHSTGYSLSQKYGAEATIFDLSSSALELGKKLAPNCHLVPDLVCGDFHELPFTDNYFDLVYMFAALHHAKDYKLVAREMQRVLAPNGLLCIFQEPFEREACFYKFRTNRPYKFTSFEKALDKEDLLTTVAEPVLGSRDEILFGMIENQNIPLPSMLAAFSQSCDVLEVTPYYEGKIGGVGKLWLEWGAIHRGNVDKLREMICDDLCQRIERVQPAYDRTAAGLGFSLPCEQELTDLGCKIAKRIASLTAVEKKEEYHFQAAQLFGGAVCLAVRKKGIKKEGSGSQNISKFKDVYPKQNGVWSTFSESLRYLLDETRNLVPAFTLMNHAKLETCFPAKEWLFKQEDNELYSMTLRGSSGSISLPLNGCQGLLLLRLNFVFPVGDHELPYRITIEHENCFEYSVFQEEAILYRDIIRLERSEKVLIKLEWLDVTDVKYNLGGLVKIYYAGALPLQ